MKLPVWIKDKTGKGWHHFPYELLTTYENGRVGMEAVDLVQNSRWWNILHQTDLDQLLDYSIKEDRYYLKEAR